MSYLPKNFKKCSVESKFLFILALENYKLTCFTKRKLSANKKALGEIKQYILSGSHYCSRVFNIKLSKQLPKFNESSEMFYFFYNRPCLHCEIKSLNYVSDCQIVNFFKHAEL